MLPRSFLLVAIVFVGLLTIGPVSESQAQFLGGGVAWNPYGGFFNSPFSNPYAMGRIPTPPYFAIHPPVYYSRPVARTYGYSPFPYPGFINTPEVVEMVEPAIIDNPYIQGTGAVPATETTSDGDDDGFAVNQPREILNPFVRENVTNKQWVEYHP